MEQGLGKDSFPPPLFSLVFCRLLLLFVRGEGDESRGREMRNGERREKKDKMLTRLPPPPPPPPPNPNFHLLIYITYFDTSPFS